METVLDGETREASEEPQDLLHEFHNLQQENMDKRTIEEIEIHQRSILGNILHIPDFRALTKIMEPKHFGRYAVILNFIDANPQYENFNEAHNIELLHFLKENGDPKWERWNEVTDEPWVSRNAYNSCEWLLRYYYFDARDPSKIIDTLEEYNQKRDALTELRTRDESKKYDGQAIAEKSYEEMCERHDEYYA